MSTDLVSLRGHCGACLAACWAALLAHLDVVGLLPAAGGPPQLAPAWRDLRLAAQELAEAASSAARSLQAVPSSMAAASPPALAAWQTLHPSIEARVQWWPEALFSLQELQHHVQPDWHASGADLVVDKAAAVAMLMPSAGHAYAQAALQLLERTGNLAAAPVIQGAQRAALLLHEGAGAPQPSSTQQQPSSTHQASSDGGAGSADHVGAHSAWWLSFPFKRRRV